MWEMMMFSSIGVRLPAQGPGILQRSHRMGEALIAVVGGLVPGVIEIEVMEQPSSGRGPVVQAPAAGQTEGVQ